MENPNNRIIASGCLEGALTMSHEVMNEPFYVGTLAVKRLSGALDRLPVTIPGKLLACSRLEEGVPITLSGQVRSYNKVVGGTGRLIVTLFAQNVIESAENDTLNKASLVGALCKPPIYRSTPFGREICDMMLAVNRAFGKSDYIPCIAWGRNAQYAARFGVGDKIALTGRLQSREYQKLTDSGEFITRNAYEVSAFTLEAAGAAPSPRPIVDARLAYESAAKEPVE